MLIMYCITYGVYIITDIYDRIEKYKRQKKAKVYISMSKKKLKRKRSCGEGGGKRGEILSYDERCRQQTEASAAVICLQIQVD